MALTVNFGNGGNATAVNLEQANAGSGQQATNGGTASTADTTTGEQLNPGADFVGSVKVANPGGGSGTGGTVNYGYSDGAFSFDVAGAWNSVKNAEAKLSGDSLHGEDVTFSDFVHVDVDFSNVTSKTDSASHVTIDNVKRVNVLTGFGDDSVKISLSTNSNDWQNIVNVGTGAGNDTITVGAGQQTVSANVKDKASMNTILDGRYTTSTIDGGDGNDTINLSGLKLLKSTITGGAGDDTMTGNLNSDTYVIHGNEGVDKITNFQISGDQRDHLQLDNDDSIMFTSYSQKANTTTAFLEKGGIVVFQNLNATSDQLIG